MHYLPAGSTVQIEMWNSFSGGSPVNTQVSITGTEWNAPKLQVVYLGP
jgi:hypothetical protein